MSPGTSSGSDRPARGGFALLGTIGGYVALCLLAGLGVGFVLDQILHTGPWFLIGGAVLGFIASFFLIYRLAMGELVQ